MAEQIHLEPGGLFVVGCSTSEVAGKRIGTSGAFEIGEALYEPLKNFADKHDLHLAFQGCEHINRALTIERKQQRYLILTLYLSFHHQCGRFDVSICL